MSQRALTLPELVPSPPSELPGHFADPNPRSPAWEKVLEIDPLPESFVEDGSCLKGAGLALGIETLAALCVYGVWRLWNVLR